MPVSAFCLQKLMYLSFSIEVAHAQPQHVHIGWRACHGRIGPGVGRAPCERSSVRPDEGRAS